MYKSNYGVLTFKFSNRLIFETCCLHLEDLTKANEKSTDLTGLGHINPLMVRDEPGLPLNLDGVRLQAICRPSDPRKKLSPETLCAPVLLDNVEVMVSLAGVEEAQDINRSAVRCELRTAWAFE